LAALYLFLFAYEFQVKISVIDFYQKDEKHYIYKYRTGITDTKQQIEWDLEAIRNSDIIFAHIESSNPSGYGLSSEVGYTTTRNKSIVLLNEKSKTASEIASYLKIDREAANVVFEDLNEGIASLKKL
jgi:nucleoside 2-deoxyribosyltransferase